MQTEINQTIITITKLHPEFSFIDVITHTFHQLQILPAKHNINQARQIFNEIHLNILVSK